MQLSNYTQPAFNRDTTRTTQSSPARRSTPFNAFHQFRTEYINVGKSIIKSLILVSLVVRIELRVVTHQVASNFTYLVVRERDTPL